MIISVNIQITGFEKEKTNSFDRKLILFLDWFSNLKGVITFFILKNFTFSSLLDWFHLWHGSYICNLHAFELKRKYKFIEKSFENTQFFIPINRVLYLCLTAIQTELLWWFCFVAVLFDRFNEFQTVQCWFRSNTLIATLCCTIMIENRWIATPPSSMMWCNMQTVCIAQWTQ